MKTLFLLSCGHGNADCLIASAIEHHTKLSVYLYGAGPFEEDLDSISDDHDISPSCIVVISDDVCDSADHAEKWKRWKEEYKRVPMLIVTGDINVDNSWIEEIEAIDFSMDTGDKCFERLIEMIKKHSR